MPDLRVRHQVLVVSPPDSQVHCSSLLALSGEQLLTAFFVGSAEGAQDVRIALARCEVDAIPAEPQVLFAECGQPHWNPVLSTAPDGVLWLFFKRGAHIDNWVTYACQSDDGGRTWTEPVELVPGDRSGGRGPVRHHCLIYENLWLAPGSVESWSRPARWDAFVDISADGGRSWCKVPIPFHHDRACGAGVIQPALWRCGNGDVAVMCRSSEGRVFYSRTSNPYRWPTLRPLSLPNNNSGLAVQVLPNGRLLCAHNPGCTSWGPRCPLVLSSFADDGITFQQLAVVDDGRAFGGTHQVTTHADGRPRSAGAGGVVTTGVGEYSYPSMQVVGDELVISYTWQRRAIVLARLTGLV